MRPQTTLTTGIVKILPLGCYDPRQLSEHPGIVFLEQGLLHAVARKAHAACQCEHLLEESLRNGRAHAWGVANVSLVTRHIVACPDSPMSKTPDVDCFGVGGYTSVFRGPKRCNVEVCCSGSAL
jgi:hypothetical protein